MVRSYFFVVFWISESICIEAVEFPSLYFYYACIDCVALFM